MQILNCIRPKQVHVGARFGFTLIEMLVVVAIIVILISMLLPGLRAARAKSRESKCEANMRILTSAYQTYAMTNGRQLPGSNTGQAWDWLGDGNTTASITSGILFSYIGAMDAYRCPDHVYPWYLNSYSVNGKLNGEQEDEGSGGVKNHWTNSMNPGKQLVFMEEDDNRGWNINSFMLGNSQGSFVDLVPANHTGGDNVGFLDTHVEYFKWEDKDSLLRPKHNPTPTFGFNDPGNVDWDKLRPVFRSWPW